jgi:hypothetical protein
MARNRGLTVLVVAIGVLACLGAAEAAARVIEPRLSSAGTWPPGDIAAQYDVISELGRRGDPIDVVFAGSSMIRRAVDAEEFEQLTGKRSVNAALPRSSNFMIKPWLLDVVVPALRPKAVVIGVASRDFNDSDARSESYEAFVTSPGYQQLTSERLVVRAERGLSGVSALFRIRRALRSPENVWEAVQGEPDRSFLEACQAQERNRSYRSIALRGAVRQKQLANYAAGGDQTEALVETIKRLRQLRIDVTLLELPHTDDYLGLHDNPDKDYGEFEAALRSVRKATGVRLLDGRRTRSTTLFRDPLHLNCTGTVAFTALVAEAWGGEGPERVVLPVATG